MWMLLMWALTFPAALRTVLWALPRGNVEGKCKLWSPVSSPQAHERRFLLQTRRSHRGSQGGFPHLNSYTFVLEIQAQEGRFSGGGLAADHPLPPVMAMARPAWDSAGAQERVGKLQEGQVLAGAQTAGALPEFFSSSPPPRLLPQQPSLCRLCPLLP